MDRTRVDRRKFGCFFSMLVVLATGCQTVRTPEEEIAKRNLPREFTKVSLPDYVVEPPDIIVVEVLEALPGRPITGERLVKPDGTITLGFYGNVYVAGLTATEIKEKIVLHLRQYITDEVLGLVSRSTTRRARARRPRPPRRAVSSWTSPRSTARSTTSRATSASPAACRSRATRPSSTRSTTPAA